MFGHLHEHGVPVPGVDFDPETVRAPRRRMFAAHFGDGADPAFLESLPLPGVEWAIATLPDWDGSRMLPHGLREAGCKGHVAALVRDESQVRALKQAGGARIVNPFSDAADHAAETFAREILSQEN
jgi:Trk K+ transport system NAD-binding subunit